MGEKGCGQVSREKIIRAAEALADLEEGESHAAAKYLAVEAWKAMPTDARFDFISRVDFEQPFDMDLRPIAAKQLLGYWPQVMVAGLEKGEIKFAQMVNERRRWPNWKPTPDDERKIRILINKYIKAPEQEAGSE